MQLVKMRLTSLVVITAVASYAIAADLNASWWSLLLLGIGGFGVAGASNALNQVLEKDFDKLMKRTENRPLPAGRLSISNAVMFAGFLCLFGITALALFNVMAALFGMIAFILYAFVYTPLKRYSSVAVFVGAIAGALPMLIGVVAFTGELTTLAVSLFLLQFAWQYPHFWSIAFLGFDDYKRADYEFIPTDGDGNISKRISYSSVFYSSGLMIFSIALFLIGLVGLLTSISLTVLSGIYLFYSVRFMKEFNTESAKALMFSSLIYIPLVLVFLSIDKLI
jgi:protoheme IX farnesyltransferase